MCEFSSSGIYVNSYPVTFRGYFVHYRTYRYIYFKSIGEIAGG